MIKKILDKTAGYFSLVKFSHTVFAMPFALVGYFIGAYYEGHGFSLRILLLVIACMVFARSAAMSFNRLADHHFDSMNPRTAGRELPSGKMTRHSVMAFVVITSILFVVSAAFINRLTLILSPVALIIVLGYSYTKRFTSLSHLVLGLGLSLAPIGAYIAVTGNFAVLPLIYSAIVLTWVSGFDIIYALQDDDFDRKTGLFSIPSVMTRRRSLAVSVGLHILTSALVLYAGYRGEAGLFYWIGAAVFLLLLTYQHMIVKPDDLSRVNLAFGTTNGLAGLIFGLLVILDMLIRYMPK